MNTELDTAAATTKENTELNRKFLSFWTQDQLYAIKVASVVQIISIQEITRIPNYPYYAKGIINLRGNVIPIIDMRLRFGKPEAEHTDRTCIIVTNINEKFFGFIVDSVEGVATIEEEQISPPPQKVSESDSSFLTGIARLTENNVERLILLLDASLLLAEHEMGMLTASL